MSELDEIKKRLDVLEAHNKEVQAYYARQKDSTARDEKKANPVSNVDKNNVTILQAELQNLELSKNPTPEQKSRIQSLKDKLQHLRFQKEEQSGNPNNQDRPDKR